MTCAADEAILELNWELWCALGHKGRDWVQMVACGGEQLPDGGYRVKVASYRVEEFIALCARFETTSQS